MLIATVPVHDEDGSVGTIHIRFESRADYDGFIRDLTADMCDTSDVTLAEVPATWDCSGRDGCMVMA
jgi:hypothetical protein